MPERSPVLPDGLVMAIKRSCMLGAMAFGIISTRLPFVWDYDLDEDQFRRLLSGTLTIGRLDRTGAAGGLPGGGEGGPRGAPPHPLGEPQARVRLPGGVASRAPSRTRVALPP